MGYIEDLRKVIGSMPVNMVASTVLVINEKGQVLLQKRKEPIDTWGLPGGLLELGESTEAAGKREVQEETGLVVDELKLIGVFSGVENYIKLKNGDEYYAVLVAYYTKSYEGIPIPDGVETLECKFFDIYELPNKVLDRHKRVVDKYLEISNA